MTTLGCPLVNDDATRLPVKWHAETVSVEPKDLLVETQPGTVKSLRSVLVRLPDVPHTSL